MLKILIATPGNWELFATVTAAAALALVQNFEQLLLLVLTMQLDV